MPHPIIPLAFLLPVVSFAVVYLKYTRIDSRLQPIWILDLWLWASVLLTIVMMVYALRPFLDYLRKPPTPSSALMHCDQHFSHVANTSGERT